MATRSASKNSQLSGQMLQAIMNKLQEQDARIASLIDTKASTKPAVAAKAAPELEIEVTKGNYGTGLVLRFGGKKSGRFLYGTEWELIKKHAAEIDAAFRNASEIDNSTTTHRAESNLGPHFPRGQIILE
jgi:hypothetical protein